MGPRVPPVGPGTNSGTNGVNGAAGATGPVRPRGTPGVDGTPGDDGEPGPPGLQGTTGPQGTQGPGGPPGDQGNDGEEGIPGVPGPTGAAGPAGPAVFMDGEPGADGEFWATPSIVAGLTANVLPKVTMVGLIGSSISDSGTLITATNPIVGTAAANGSGLTVNQTNTAQTTSAVAVLNVINSGSYDTTAGAIVDYGAKIALTGSRSAPLQFPGARGAIHFGQRVPIEPGRHHYLHG